MNIDLAPFLSSPLALWIVLVVVLAAAFVILRYFLHIVMHILRFLWHGCLVLVVLLLVLYLLRFFKLI